MYLVELINDENLPEYNVYPPNLACLGIPLASTAEAGYATGPVRRNAVESPRCNGLMRPIVQSFVLPGCKLKQVEAQAA
ncbi:hypothetical protein Hte_001072 [Hypoxylon texense]